MQLLDSGSMLTTEIIGRFITKNLNKTNENILLTEYPITRDQYEDLIKVLENNEIELNDIWYFKQREPRQFMKDHFENGKEKKWIDKYGSEIFENWKKRFDQRRLQIIQIQERSDHSKWRIVELDYIQDITTEYLKQQIKECNSHGI